MPVEYPDPADVNSNKFIHNNIACACIIWDIDHTFINILSPISKLNKLFRCMCYFSVTA